MATNCFAINSLLTSSAENELLALIAAKYQQFNSVNVATALRRLSVANTAGDAGRWSEALWCVCTRGTAVMMHSSKELNGRTLSSAFHSSAKILTSRKEYSGPNACSHPSHGLDAIRSFISVLTDSVRSRATELDAQGFSNCLWALAILRDSSFADVSALTSAASALCRELSSTSTHTLATMNAQELANTAWAAAVLRLHDTDLMRALAKACCDCLSSVMARQQEGGSTSAGFHHYNNAAFTPQGLAMVAWSFAKCKHVDNRLLSCLSSAFISLQSRTACDPQSLANVAWAFAAVDKQDDALMGSIALAAKSKLGSFSSQGLTSLLWALSQHSAHVPAVQALLPLLSSAVSTHIPSMSAQDIGLAAWALTHVSSGTPNTPSVACRRCAMLARAVEVAGDLSWKALAHVDLAYWTTQHDSTCARTTTAERAGRKRPRSDTVPFGSTPALYENSVNNRMTMMHEELAQAADERNHAPMKCLARLLKACSKEGDCSLLDGKGTTRHEVAMFGRDTYGKLSKALRKSGYRVELVWHRFQAQRGAKEAADVQACAWPTLQTDHPSRQVPCVIIRYPGSGSEAFSVSLHAAAALLAEGGRLIVTGTVDEGCTRASVAASGANLFDSVTQLCSERVDGVDCVVISAFRRLTTLTPLAGPEGKRTDTRVQGTLQAWRTSTTLDLGALGSHLWVTYPGLFAGGVLDVMTAALLSAIAEHLKACPDTLSSKPRLLDFACGSGSIAKALSLHRPKAKLHLLDADALALAAASENVPGGRLHLSDGWPTDAQESSHRALREGSHAFHWIVSNPPVHSGQPDDFRVLFGLCRGAPSRLKQGGSLWVVAQEQVPVGRIMVIAAGDSFKSIRAIMVPGGRFVVWHAEARGAEV